MEEDETEADPAQANCWQESSWSRLLLERLGEQQRDKGSARVDISMDSRPKHQHQHQQQQQQQQQASKSVRQPRERAANLIGRGHFARQVAALTLAAIAGHVQAAVNLYPDGPDEKVPPDGQNFPQGLVFGSNLSTVHASDLQQQQSGSTWRMLMGALFSAASEQSGDMTSAYAEDEHKQLNWPNLLLALVLILLMLTTAIGNLFVIVAILIERNLRTIGNYLVLSLAIADLLVALLVMPLASIYLILDRWTLGVLLCDIWTSADVFCCTASILHLLAIALDRYWAVTRVDYIRCQRNERRILFMIAFVWMAACVISLAPVFGWKDDQFEQRITVDKECLISQDIGYQIFATCTTFYFPLTLTLVFYWKIYQVARKRIRKKLDNRAKFVPSHPSSSSSVGSAAGQVASSRQPESSSNSNNNNNNSNSNSNNNQTQSQISKNQSIVKYLPKSGGAAKFITKRLQLQADAKANTSAQLCTCSCHQLQSCQPETHKSSYQASAAALDDQQQMENRATKLDDKLNDLELGLADLGHQEKSKSVESGLDQATESMQAQARKQSATTCPSCVRPRNGHQFQQEMLTSSQMIGPMQNQDNHNSTSDIQSNSLASCSRASSLQANYHLIMDHNHNNSQNQNQNQSPSPSQSPSQSQQQQQQQPMRFNGNASSLQNQNHSSLSSANYTHGLIQMDTNSLDGELVGCDAKSQSLGRQLSTNCDCCACVLCCEDSIGLMERPLDEHEQLSLQENAEAQERYHQDEDATEFVSGASTKQTRTQTRDRATRDFEVTIDKEGKLSSNLVAAKERQQGFAETQPQNNWLNESGALLARKLAPLEPTRNMLAICWRRLILAVRRRSQASSQFKKHQQHQESETTIPVVRPHELERSISVQQANHTLANIKSQSACKLCHCLSPLPSPAHQKQQQHQQQQQMAYKTPSSNANKRPPLLVQPSQGATVQSQAAQMEGVESKRERKAAKTLAIITGVFVVCWLPFFVMAIAMPLLQLRPHKYLFALLLWLGYANSMLNPIIYTIFSPDFRKAFKRLLCGSDESCNSSGGGGSKSRQSHGGGKGLNGGGNSQNAMVTSNGHFGERAGLEDGGEKDLRLADRLCCLNRMLSRLVVGCCGCRFCSGSSSAGGSCNFQGKRQLNPNRTRSSAPILNNTTTSHLITPNSSPKSIPSLSSRRPTGPSNQEATNDTGASPVSVAVVQPRRQRPKSVVTNDF